MGLGGLLRFGKNQAKTVLPGISPDKKPLTAPAPTGAGAVPAIGAPTPPDAAAAAAAAIPAAQNAAKKARRKGLAPALPVSQTVAPAAKTIARGLFGF